MLLILETWWVYLNIYWKGHTEPMHIGFASLKINDLITYHHEQYWCVTSIKSQDFEFENFEKALLFRSKSQCVCFQMIWINNLIIPPPLPEPPPHTPPPTTPTTKLLGGILVSPCPSDRPSLRPAFCVRSVMPTVQIVSISYLYILSSNLRRCVTCKFCCWI